MANDSFDSPETAPTDHTEDAEIDWEALRAEAWAMTERSYAPYSGVRVGAAALTDTGEIVRGCNVENASTGIGICAEVTLGGQFIASDAGTRLVALAVVAGDGETLSPCGRCRQFLYEFGGTDLAVDWHGTPRTLGELLPDAFGPGDVKGRAG